MCRWQTQDRQRASRTLPVALIALLAGVAGAGSAPAPDRRYAVVVSKETLAQPAWEAVVRALVTQHQGEVFAYSGTPRACQEALAARLPRYACFVTRPEEAGRAFVIEVSRMTRDLDGDPYTDLFWGILTGYTPEDALRIASQTEPLVVRRAAAGTGIDLGRFEAGVWYSEGEAGVRWEKPAGGQPQRLTGPQDSTEALVRALNEFRPDLFSTSGHATERDWQIGYSYRNGQFRCQDGVLYGLDLNGRRFPVQSPNPKVYLPLGNCLMGHIRDRDSMALAFMASAGVCQMPGYVVSTWFGYGGWGIGDFFIGQPGRFSLAEAFVANGHALVHRLARRFPGKAFDVDLADYEIEKDPHCTQRIAARLGYSGWDSSVRDNVGLLWDRDTVAFYGDPAWDARLAPGELAWEQRLDEKDGVWTFAVTARTAVTPSRPPLAFFPHRLTDLRVIAGQELEPVVTDDFILLGGLVRLDQGRTYTVAFSAHRAPAGR